MFDVGFAELLLIGVVALLVLGPERLPKAARMAGLWMRKARASWYSMRAELERELADEELKRSLQQARSELSRTEAELREGGKALLGDTAALGDAVNRELAAATSGSPMPMPAIANDGPASATDTAADSAATTEQPVSAKRDTGIPGA